MNRTVWTINFFICQQILTITNGCCRPFYMINFHSLNGHVLGWSLALCVASQCPQKQRSELWLMYPIHPHQETKFSLTKTFPSLHLAINNSCKKSLNATAERSPDCCRNLCADQHSFHLSLWGLSRPSLHLCCFHPVRHCRTWMVLLK